MNNRDVDEARRQREARDKFDSSDDSLKQDEIRRVLRQGKPGLMESVAKPIMICLMLIMGALGFFTFGPALRSEGNQHIKSGISLSEQGRLTEAVAEFDEAIRLNPKLVQAYYHRGNVYRSLGQYEPAFQNYTDAIRLDTQFAPAYANRAVVFAFFGDQDNGNRYYREHRGSRGAGYRVDRSRSLPCHAPDGQMGRIIESILRKSWSR